MDKQLLSKTIIDAMNFRIQQEEHSARLYEQMMLWFKDKGYKNLAKLYEGYVADERSHADWAKSFLLDYNLQPELKPLPSPYAEYSSCMDIFEATLEHEILVTEQVTELTNLAEKEGNRVLFALGLKYTAEQQEELGKSYDIISVAKLTTDMLVLDSYIGENYLN